MPFHAETFVIFGLDIQEECNSMQLFMLKKLCDLAVRKIQDLQIVEETKKLISVCI